MNIIIMGVAHSGTSIMAGMLYKLGWKTEETDGKLLKYGESSWIKYFNHEFRTKKMEGKKKKKFQVKLVDKLVSLSEPYVLKDARFCYLLHHWIVPIALSGTNPILVYITRDIDRIKHSFEVRDEMENGLVAPGKVVEELIKMAEESYRLWPLLKCKIRYEDMVEAVKLFDVDRNDIDNKNVGKAGYL